MLNYVWIGLIIVGIFVAVGNDIADEIGNTFRNGETLTATVRILKSPSPLRESWEAELVMSAADFNAFYGTSEEEGNVFSQDITITRGKEGETSCLITIDDSAPSLWKTMAANASSKGKLTGVVTSFQPESDAESARIGVILESIGFVKVRAVTDAALDYASIAVNIALGLIGIMALWLGVMKVAEEAGLVKSLTRLLRPLTKLLFPDVPPDHPAVGAMIMNIAANMLGLSNAATPLGLKAMEELNKINPKLGTATNAMCTFLVINTAGLVLIPATAIAVRAAAGSANPGIIIGTSIFGASCATIAGLIAVKLLEKLPRYKKQLEVDNG